jgi:hypothetical protein
MMNVCINFVTSAWIYLYPANCMFESCAVSSMKLDQLIIGRGITLSMCWHYTLAKTSTPDLNWIQENHFFGYHKKPLSLSIHS